MFEWVTPDWHSPRSVKALVTLAGDTSASPYGMFNTADHVGDDPQRVERDRAEFFSVMNLPPDISWITQVHGVDCVQAAIHSLPREADAVWTDQPKLPCMIHTADCLPVFFCDQAGSKVALAHAGWRGLLAGVLENTLRHFPDPQQVLVWLGPAIGPASFQVGEEVFNAFMAHDKSFEAAFQPQYLASETPVSAQTWLCDLYTLAASRLARQGVAYISGGAFDTFTDSRYFSYRRNNVCGRMLSAIWIDPAQ